MQTVELTIKVPVKIIKQENIYVSCCPVFDVYSQGETRKQAKQNIMEAVKIFLTTCYERGTLEAVMKECGFMPAKRMQNI